MLLCLRLDSISRSISRRVREIVEWSGVSSSSAIPTKRRSANESAKRQAMPRSAPVRWPTAYAPPTNPLAVLDAAACPSPWTKITNKSCGYRNNLMEEYLDFHHRLLRKKPLGGRASGIHLLWFRCNCSQPRPTADCEDGRLASKAAFENPQVEADQGMAVKTYVSPALVSRLISALSTRLNMTLLPREVRTVAPAIAG